MKKLIFLVVAAFLISGCRENYLAEKAFYKAKKALTSIDLAVIEADPKSALAPAIETFQGIAEKYPTTQQAAQSLFLIADLQVKQKNFEAARATLQKVIQNFTGNGEWAPQAYFKTGQLYETDGLWQKAERAYWETTEYYPLSKQGLYVPLYIVLHYKEAKDVLKQNEAYERGVEYFGQSLKDVGPIEISTSVRNALALLHLAQGNETKAREEWNTLVEQFPKSQYAPLALLTVADISWKEGNFAQSFLDYENFFKRYSKHSAAGRTTVHVGLLHQKQKEYAKAREWFNRAIEEYFQKDRSNVADLKLLIGRTYQDEGLWDQADQVYRELEGQYSDTQAALQVPFLRSAHHTEIGETEKANQILDQAIERYMKIVKENPNSKIGRHAERFIFQAYSQKKDWAQFLAKVDEELKQETNEEKRGRWLFLKALVAQNRLNDKDQALNYYKDFAAEFPGHPLSQMAKVQQEQLLSTT